MSQLIAKKFVSVDYMIEHGIEIPKGTKLYDEKENPQGEYLEHVQKNGLNFHTRSISGFGSLPFPPTMYGIIIKRPFPIEAIAEELKITVEPECEHDPIETPFGYECSRCHKLL